MTTRYKTWRNLSILTLFVTGLAAAVTHCDDDDDNSGCESKCVSNYQSDLSSCENEVATCMESCSGPDDSLCMWDCEDLGIECETNLNTCLASCPCAKKMQNCILDCFDNGNDKKFDTNCMMDCSQKYVDCAGSESPYNCSTLCQANSSSCLMNCENDSTDITGYLNCRVDCHQAALSCLDSCA